MDNNWRNLPDTIRKRIELMLNTENVEEIIFDDRIVETMRNMPESATLAALNELSSAVANRQTPIHNPRAYFNGIVNRMEKRSRSSQSSQIQLPSSVMSKIREFEDQGFCKLSEIDETGLNLLIALPEPQAIRALDEVRSVGRNRIRNLSALLVSICRRLDVNQTSDETATDQKKKQLNPDIRQVPHFSSWPIMSIYAHGQSQMPTQLRLVKSSHDPMFNDEYSPVGSTSASPYMTSGIGDDVISLLSREVASEEMILKLKSMNSRSEGITDEIDSLVRDGRARREDFDSRIVAVLEKAPRGVALKVLHDYAAKDKSKIINAPGFVRGMIKKAMEREEREFG